MNRSLSLLLLAGLMAGCGEDLEVIAQVPVPPPPASQYKLEADVEMKVGIRAYAETTYKFYEKRGDGAWRQLWSVLLPEHYDHHWISPEGRVWVATKWMSGPGGGARLWVRTSRGDTIAEWSGHEYGSAPHQGGAGLGEGWLEGFSIDPVKSELRLLRSQWVEQLRLVTKSGSESRATLYFGPDRHLAILSRGKEQESGARILESLLADENYELPTAESVRPEQLGWLLWRARHKTTGRERVWIQSSQHRHPQNVTNKILPLRELELKARPAHLTVTPSGLVLLFEFRTQEDPAALLNVLRSDLTELKSIDLQKLGRFEGAYEAEISLRYPQVRRYEFGDWVPADSPSDIRSPSPEVVDFFDRKGRRYVVKVSTETGKSQVEATLFDTATGVTQKEPRYDQPPLSTKIFTSPTGRFSLRVRQYPLPKGQDQPKIGYLTLLAKVPQAEGQAREVELWSNVFYGDVEAASVSESGRVAVAILSWIKHFERDQSEGKMQHRAMLQIYHPDTFNNPYGFDLVAEMGLARAADLPSVLKEAALQFKQHGLKGTHEVEGIAIPTWQGEELVLPVRGGRTKSYFIMNNYMGGRMHVVMKDSARAREYLGIQDR